MALITSDLQGSLKRAWQLMSLCVKTFPPSVDFRPYVEVFFYHASHGACGGGKEKDNIIQASQVGHGLQLHSLWRMPTAAVS